MRASLSVGIRSGSTVLIEGAVENLLPPLVDLCDLHLTIPVHLPTVDELVWVYDASRRNQVEL